MADNDKKYSNATVAQYLNDIATAYEIKNKNYFRIVSYQNAAETIINYPKNLYQIWQKDKTLLDEVPSIGPSIMDKIDYLFTHHRPHPAVKRAFKGIHPAVFTFTRINGIGPKTAQKLTKLLTFSKDPLKALDQLIDYAKNGKIRDFPDFGQKSEESILENTLHFLGQKKRMTLSQAESIANDLITYLKKGFPDVEFYPLGSLRRRATTVGDIDIAAKSEKEKEILSYFVDYPNNIQTLALGPKKASIRLKGEIRSDLMVQPVKSFGSLLQHFTGSRQHNILLRRYAQEMGYSLSEYGIKDLRTGKTYTFDNEKDFYNFLKLCYIPPQDRVGESEIEQAKKCYTRQDNHLK